MLPGRVADVRHCVLTSRWLPAALALLLLLSSSLSCVQSTTVEHDFHIVHNVDNRSLRVDSLPRDYKRYNATATQALDAYCRRFSSPEIDPFWYVGRGVRPIGRFGKRHSSVEALGSRGMQPVVRILELLFNSLRNKENLKKVLDGKDRDWLP